MEADQQRADLDRLRIVVVNYDGGLLLRRCVDDLLAMDWPGQRQIVVVDNASTDDSLSTLAPNDELTIVRMPTNGGFGANNEALGDLDDVDWVALVNPDAFVPSNFATALTAAFDSPSMGAAAPKIVFDDRHYSLPIVTDAGQNIRLAKVEIGGVDVTSRCHVIGDGAARVATASGAEWHLGETCALLAPASSDGQAATLFFRSPAPAELTIAGLDATSSEAGSTIDVPLTGNPQQYIQNAGSWVDGNGIGGNRGFFQLDDGRFDRPALVFAWCGAAVMLRSSYLADVGLFDPDYFLYYEDTDLSWRGQSRGWTYRYVPDVVVRHRHSASTGQGSALTDVYQQRNRLRMLARNASAPVLTRGVAQSIGAAAKIGVRRVVALRDPGSKGDSTLFVRRAKGIALAGRDLPALLKARKDLSANRTVSQAEVERRLGS